MKRLRQHQEVAISLPGHSDPLEATVLIFSERGMGLEVADKRRVMRMPECVPGSLLTFRSNGSTVALSGTAYPVFRTGDVRFLVDDAFAHLDRGTRYAHTMPVEVRPVNSDISTPCMTVQIGPSGMFVKGDLSLEVGEEVMVSLDPENGSGPIGGVARVVDRRADGVFEFHLTSEGIDVRLALGGIAMDFSRNELAFKRRETKAVAVPDF